MKEKIIYKFTIVINLFTGIIDLIYGIKFQNFYQSMCGILFIILAWSIFVTNYAINKRDNLIKRQEKTIKEILKLGDYNE